MGNWTENVKLDPISFDGDEVSVTISRLTVPDMLTLSKHLSQSETGEQKLSFTGSMELMATAVEIIPKYVKGITGLTKGDGVAFTLEEFIEIAPQQAYFMALLGTIMADLVEHSTVQVEDEKNSEALSDGTLKALP